MSRLGSYFVSRSVQRAETPARSVGVNSRDRLVFFRPCNRQRINHWASYCLSVFLPFQVAELVVLRDGVQFGLIHAVSMP